MRVLLEFNGAESTVEFANSDCEIPYTTKYSRKFFIRTFLSSAIDNRDAKIYGIEIQSDNPSEEYINYYVYPGTWLLKQQDWTAEKLREIAVLNTKIKLEEGKVKDKDIINCAELARNNISIDEEIQHLTKKLKETQEKKIGFC